MVSLARRLLGLPYGILAAARVNAYARGIFPSRRPPVPVISVGNLSVGGTGKTPLVVHLVGKILAKGFQPGVLSRGYGKAGGEDLNDEGRLLEFRFPGLPQAQEPDRLAGAERLLALAPLDCLVLDDAFQHLRIGRDLDLVCLAGDRPWFEDTPLPLGRLREFPSALARAHLLVLTHLEGLSGEEISVLRERAARDSGGRPVALADHRPSALLFLEPGGEGKPEFLPLSEVEGKKVFLFSAIGSPRSFRATVDTLGGRVAGHLAFRDHHRFTSSDLEKVSRAAREAGADLVLTTEKDYARGGSFPFPAWVLKVDLVFREGEELLDRLLEKTLGGNES